MVSEHTTSVRKKWDSMYKKICKMAETGNEGGGNGEDDDAETFEMNEELMYVELMAV
jgi:basic membrane lipoprotein Med (substrate-binding protein (PBP1-ABC) superfamily)